MAVSRITAPMVNDRLDDHLSFHENKANPKLHNQSIILFGEKGDDGLVGDVRDLKHCYQDIDKRLSAIEGYVKWLLLLMMGAIVSSLLNVVMK